MEPRSELQGIGKGEGVRKSSGQCQRLAAPLRGAVRIAQEPQSEGLPGSANDSGILSIKRGQSAMPLRITKGDALLQIGLALSQLSQMLESLPAYPVGQQEKRGILLTLGESEELLR